MDYLMKKPNLTWVYIAKLSLLTHDEKISQLSWEEIVGSNIRDDVMYNTKEVSIYTDVFMMRISTLYWFNLLSHKLK